MATLTVLVAAPAAAEAKSSTTASQRASVQVNVDKATTAVNRMTRYVRLGKDDAAARQLMIARVQIAAASRMARFMAATADAGVEGIAAAEALTLVCAQYDDLAEAITALVNQITGQAQTQFVNAIVPSLVAKQKVIDTLTSMLDTAPAEAKPMIAAIIAALAATDPTEVSNLKAALDSGRLPIDIAAKISQALAMATAYYDRAFTMIASIVPLMPKEVQAPLLLILNGATAPIDRLRPTVLSTITAMIGKILGMTPFAAGTLPSSHSLSSLHDLSRLAAVFSEIVASSQRLPSDVSSELDAVLAGLPQHPGGDFHAAISSLLAKISALISQLMGGLGGIHPASAT
jgi:hypothetical protein